MFDVVALGELLIDFTPAGFSEKGNVLFERNPGGAPANVLAALAKLGKKVSFIGKVGNDQFGNFLREVLEANHIDTTGLVFSEEVNTTLAFVHLDETGDRSFSFYRKPGADMMLTKEEINSTQVQQTRIFHFGSLSMTHEPVKSATMKALKHGREKGILISYDPNLRPALWQNLDQAKEVILQGMEYADILKISEEELLFLTATEDLEKGTEMLRAQYDVQLVLVTLGAEGCFYRFRENTGLIKGYKVKAVDTTGAGDGFFGGALYQVLQKNKKIQEFTVQDVEDSIRFANAVGALATTKKGAIDAMPSLEQVQELMK